MRRVKLQLVHGYCGTVSAVGLAVLVFLVFPEGEHIRQRLNWVFWIFAIFVGFGELYPLRIPRGDAEGAITTSTTFAFAILLAFGTAPAVLVLALASAIADMIGRRVWWKVLFNVAQYTLALSASGLVLDVFVHYLGGLPRFAAQTLLGILAAGAVFFLLNVAITAVAVALIQHMPLLAFLRQDVLFHASTTGALVAISPIVVVSAEHSLALIPLIAVPMLIAYRTASISLEKEHQALHDALTGLPNRALFHDRAQQAILAARRQRRGVAVMLLDLDRFKDVNDTLGHHVGDLLLKEVGPRLQGVLRDSDTVARLGGDEFGIVLSALADPAETRAVAERITAALKRPIVTETLRLDVEGSIGIALYPDHGDDADTLLQRADVAMYLAKKTPDGYATYRADHDHYSPQRLALVGDLRRAVTDGQLVLYYQPKVWLPSMSVAGFEALARWNHPTHGLIPPDEFIPLAEQTGIIKPLTMLVLQQALQQCRAWHNAGHQIGVAVNLSARTIHDAEFPNEVERLLHTFQLHPRWLTLELTESTVMADPVRSMETLSRLQGMGIDLSIDDFGTGYSSLAYLKRLPVHEIKIDKSFVMNMASDDNDAVIVRSTIDLGQNLGLRVVAEGVETAEVRDRLAAMRCDVAQGYHLSRPIPADEATDWIVEFTRTQQHDLRTHRVVGH
jgi:diguanylate cyclase (GGDEF)-like protein